MAKMFSHFTKPELTLPVQYRDLNPNMKRLVREQYVLNQEGQCYHCAYPLHKDPPAHLLRIEIKEELFPENFFDHPVHLHHDHNTGETLGAVHARCNAILWQYYGE